MKEEMDLVQLKVPKIIRQEKWLERAKEIHGEKYGYEKVQYIDSYHKVILRCIEHDLYFEIDPITVVRSNTTSETNLCPECKVNRKYTEKEFLEAITNKYGDLYGLEKVKFKTTRDPITLICRKHGEFQKIARYVTCKDNRELCPKCVSESRTEMFDRVKQYTDDIEKGNGDGVFYKLLVTHIPTKLKFIKIGITSLSTYQRYPKKYYKDFDFEIIEEAFVTNLESAILERKFKEENKHKRFHLPTYIKFGGRTELYLFDDEYQLQNNQIKIIRDGLILKQNNICPICTREITMPTLDHYHSKRHGGSGLIRGVICNVCNRFLGSVENQIQRSGFLPSAMPDILRELASYMLDSREPFMHPKEKPPEKLLKKSSYNTLIKLMKISGYKKKIPAYPTRKKLSKELDALYKKFDLTPLFY